MTVRAADELAAVPSPAWPLVVEWIDHAPVTVETIGVDQDSGLSILYRLQVTAASVLGALALNCGALLADHGWFKLLGGGGGGLPDLATASQLPDDPALSAGPPGSLLVGFDVLGGRFAVDGGGLGVAPGEVCYFGPDTLQWQGLGGGHADFVHAALSGGLSEAFQSLRWEGWEDETAALSPDQGLSLFPPPFTQEGKDISSVSRRAVPLTELLGFFQDAAANSANRGSLPSH